MQSTVTAITNQKGGVLKTTTAENIGIGMAREGKRVLLVDMDPQASLTIALGYQRPDELPVTLQDILMKILTDKEILLGEGILHHPEGIDLMPSISVQPSFLAM